MLSIQHSYYDDIEFFVSSNTKLKEIVSARKKLAEEQDGGDQLSEVITDDERLHVIYYDLIKSPRELNLRCPYCGSPLRLYGVATKWLIFLKTDETVLAILPRAQCTNDHCPEKEKRGDKHNITHVLFPDHLSPFLRYESRIVELIAKLRLELERLGILDKPMEEVKQSNLLKSLKEKVKSLLGSGRWWWEWLVVDYVTQKIGQNCARYYKAILNLLKEALPRAHAAKQAMDKGMADGWRPHRDFRLSKKISELKHLLRLLTSYPVTPSSNIATHPPWEFWRIIASYGAPMPV